MDADGPMGTADVVSALRQDDIVVLHAVRQAPTPSGEDLVVVYLEATRGQAASAASCLDRLPDVARVSFAQHTRAIMYVLLRPAYGRTSGTPAR